MAKVWFGINGDMRWVDAPQANYQMTDAQWSVNNTSLLGNSFARSSVLRHKEFMLSWSPRSVAHHADLLYLLSQPGPFYYVDPLAAKTNIMPAYLSCWSPGVKYLLPACHESADTIDRSWGAPAKSLKFGWGQEITKLQIPPDHDVWVRVRGETGTIQFGSTAVEVSKSATGDPVTTKIDSQPTGYAMTVTAWGGTIASTITVRLYPKGTQPLNESINFIVGQGTGPLILKEAPTETVHSAVINNYQRSITASFTERIA